MPKKPVRTQKKLLAENEDLRARLDEAEEILRAIRNGEVDALIITGVGGEQIMTLKQVEEAMRLSEEKYRTLVDEVNDGFYMADEAGVFTFANPAMAGIYGVETPQALLGRKYLDFVVPEMLAELGEAHRSMMQAGHAPAILNSQIVHPDGTRAFIEVKAASIVKGDQIVGIRGVVRDVTERKQMEQALAESEIKFRWLYEYAPVAYHILTPEGSITDVNRRWCELLGYRREEALGRAIFDFVVEEEREAAKASFEKKKQNKEPYVEGSERNFRTKDGAIRTFKTYDFFVLDERQNLSSVQTTIEDITVRKQAEEALAWEQYLLRTLLDNLPDRIYFKDRYSRFTRISKSQAEMFGLSDSAEALGKTDFDFFTEAHALPAFVAEQNIMATGQPVLGLEEKETWPDGRETWVNTTKMSLQDQAGNIIGTFGISSDITERKRAEQALQNSEIKLRSLFAAMLDVIIVLDTDGRYLEIAPTNPTNLYRPPDELVGRTVTELLPPDQASFFIDTIRQTLKTGQLTNTEYSIRFGSQDRWFSASVSPLSSNSVIWVAHDITHRKVAEEKNQRQLEHLSALSAIDRVIAANFDLRLSLSEILTHVTMELGVDAADILILNPGSQMLEYGAERGFRTQAARKAQVRLGESHAGRAALERSLVQIPNLKDEKDKAFLTTRLAGEDFVCYYGVPLIAKGQVKGVLEIYQRSALAPDDEWLDFLNTLAGQAAIAIENSTLFEGLQRSNSELSLAYDATIEGWSHALDLRDKETEGHTQRVTEMTLKLARLFGLSEAELVQVRWGALLHDIGKMGVPDGILLKPGPLTDEEWVAMKKHPAFAYEMLLPIRYLRAALDIPYCHHEKWDGTGYPRGLKGTQIPLAARIFAVVDVWDALISDRPYRQAWSEEKARQYIQAETGTHFDPQVVLKFFTENGL